ncbi:MAG: 1-deoxy-D-xylulose-5-phosphate reductoisomerase, partial [Hyphomicrobium sp.]
MAVTASMPHRLPERSSSARRRADDASRPMRLSVLGATGSVGTSTLDLVSRTPDRFEIVALTAQSNAVELAALARRHRAKLAVIGDETRLAELRDA